MRKVLIVEGSPRKGGNSDALCREFERGAVEAGHEVEKIYLRDLAIGNCRACDACRKTGACVQKDDGDGLLGRMLDADAIVLATPVYFYSMSGWMKTAIDRMLPRYTELAGKAFYFIATAAAGRSAMSRTMDALRGFTDCIDGAVVAAEIYGSGAWEKGAIEGNPALAEAYEAGRAVK